MSSFIPTNTGGVKSLYRSLLREANNLPYGYLRAFFRFKYRDDVSSAARSVAHDKKSSTVKLKRLRREVRRLRATNEGHRKSLARLLDLAFGRTGKLRRELLEPFLHSSTIKEPIIPGVEKSRPPVYTKELTALLLSPFSRSTRKGLKGDQLKTPPSLPPRVDPSSEEARLLGPLSKRREVNARWRFFTNESKRVLPPFQVLVQNVDRGAGVVTTHMDSDQNQKITDLGLINGGFQDSGLLESLQKMAGNFYPPKTRRERKASPESKPKDVVADNTVVPLLPTRVLRRSHRILLGKLPLLTYCDKISAKEGKSLGGSYEVSLATIANSPTLRYTTARLPVIDERSLAWVRRATEIKVSTSNTY